MDLLYAVACAIDAPLNVTGLVELVEARQGKRIPENSARTSIAGDRRFCWAGPGRYALYRHGALPGPRTLGEASRLTLHFSPKPLTLDEIDHWLRGIGYEYQAQSLVHSVRRSQWMTYQPDGRVGLYSSEEGENHLRPKVAPNADGDSWSALRNAVALRLAACLAERADSYTFLPVPQWAPRCPDWAARAR
ncbi:hypothetical protein [Streptomyces sp. NPDC058280]|uniref:hypothetical protein n=1 Tax=Streptomyces sp. NPDC058280 TaxID=3346419 RepID=UPI0036E7BB64